MFVRTGPEYVEVRRTVVAASGDPVTTRTTHARLTVTAYDARREMSCTTQLIASHVAESLVMLNEVWTQLERECHATARELEVER